MKLPSPHNILPPPSFHRLKFRALTSKQREALRAVMDEDDIAVLEVGSPAVRSPHLPTLLQLCRALLFLTRSTAYLELPLYFFVTALVSARTCCGWRRRQPGMLTLCWSACSLAATLGRYFWTMLHLNSSYGVKSILGEKKGGGILYNRPQWNISLLRNSVVISSSYPCTPAVRGLLSVHISHGFCCTEYATTFDF